jgi:hypothetical protein
MAASASSCGRRTGQLIAPSFSQLPFWNGALPGTVLCKQDVVACLYVYDPDAGVVRGEQTDYLRPDLTTAEVLAFGRNPRPRGGKRAPSRAPLESQRLDCNCGAPRIHPEFHSTRSADNPAASRHTKSRVRVRRVVGTHGQEFENTESPVSRWKSPWNRAGNRYPAEPHVRPPQEEQRPGPSSFAGRNRRHAAPVRLDCGAQF